jgi:dipeptidyl aminopeptidase/acylaminoacyl peptidase
MVRLVCLGLWLTALMCAQKPVFDVQALLKIARLSDPQLSPDGKTVSFNVQRVDVDQNTKPTQIYAMPTAGGTPKQITSDGSKNTRARWAPDGKHIAYVSNRSGASQIWLMDPDGTNARQVTNLSTEADGVLFSPDGKKLVFASAVYPDCPDEACNKARLDEENKSKVKARTYTSLLYRHWTGWQDKRRSHVFVMDIEGGPAKDLTPGSHDVPPFSLGGPDDYAISPDSSEVVYAMNPEASSATSTNTDLFAVPIAGGDAKRLTTAPGADVSPQYSPDGKFIAYRSQERGGYESDRWRLAVLDRASGRTTILADSLDRPVESFAWFPDSSRLFFTAEDRGRQTIQIIPSNGGATKVIASGPQTLDDMVFSTDGKTMIYTAQSGAMPTEIYRASSAGGAPAPLTHLNDDLLAQYDLKALEDFWVEGAEKTKVQSFIVKPNNFQEGVKYPVLFLLHGGPEGAWGESWTYRWNAQVFASAGFVVIEPNPRGSTGYGQKFTEDIKEDWGGKVYEDIMAVVDHVAALPYVDSDRMAAAGGSYGGYMVDWLLGHTTRFKTLVSHAGVYDLRSEFGATEEIWFPLWEYGGAPWEKPEVYEKWSPSNFAANFKTPTLVIHGELDFRVPYTQGLQLFTALQLQKVPSKLLVFPDEGHWVLKPQNSVLWYNTFLEWIGEWTKKAPAQ